MCVCVCVCVYSVIAGRVYSQCMQVGRASHEAYFLAKGTGHSDHCTHAFTVVCIHRYSAFTVTLHVTEKSDNFLTPVELTIP